MFRLEDCIAYITSRGAKVLAERLEERFEGSGISRVQWIAMYYVNGCPSITQKQLTVVRLLDRMEADHMLRRVCSRTDRRVRYLEMTEQGMELYQGLLGRVEQFKEDAIKGIDEEKLEVFKEVLGQMLNNTEH